MFDLKANELQVEEILIKADFHPLLLSQLLDIEQKHDSRSSAAIGKLKRCRASASDACLAFAKHANDTFLTRRKLLCQDMSNTLLHNTQQLRHERTRLHASLPSTDAASFATNPVAAFFKRNELHETHTGAIPAWMALEAAKGGRPGAARRRKRRRVANAVPLACEGLSPMDVEDDVAMIRVLCSKSK
ncbi:hypothetical protein BC830DRAFT_1117626 [Chytriomyces sp. MP71]|nr:hypothetical protein BC830DRAFT_1117626 [Chytriomyces sp. MP71]